jgi:hypothetical protein
MGHKRQDEMFSQEDADKAGNILKAAVIETISRRKITFAEFSELHLMHMVRVGVPTGKITSRRNNLLKDLLGKNELSYKRFAHIMKDILGLNLTNFSMNLRDKDNVLLHLSVDRISY